MGDIIMLTRLFVVLGVLILVPGCAAMQDTMQTISNDHSHGVVKEVVVSSDVQEKNRLLGSFDKSRRGFLGRFPIKDLRLIVGQFDKSFAIKLEEDSEISKEWPSVIYDDKDNKLELHYDNKLTVQREGDYCVAFTLTMEKVGGAAHLYRAHEQYAYRNKAGVWSSLKSYSIHHWCYKDS
ncbi:hypothetical protein ACFLY0_00710 [Patescibacteria group bacterium]